MKPKFWSLNNNSMRQNKNFKTMNKVKKKYMKKKIEAIYKSKNKGNKLSPDICWYRDKIYERLIYYYI